MKNAGIRRWPHFLTPTSGSRHDATALQVGKSVRAFQIPSRFVAVQTRISHIYLACPCGYISLPITLTRSQAYATRGRPAPQYLGPQAADRHATDGRKKSAQEIPDRLFFRLHCRF